MGTMQAPMLRQLCYSWERALCAAAALVRFDGGETLSAMLMNETIEAAFSRILEAVAPLHSLTQQRALSSDAARSTSTRG
jgi:hypothetical protein